MCAVGREGFGAEIFDENMVMMMVMVVMMVRRRRKKEEEEEHGSRWLCHGLGAEISENMIKYCAVCLVW